MYKNMILVVVVMLLLSFAITSCGEDDGDKGNPVPVANFIVFRENIQDYGNGIIVSDLVVSINRQISPGNVMDDADMYYFFVTKPSNIEDSTNIYFSNAEYKILAGHLEPVLLGIDGPYTVYRIFGHHSIEGYAHTDRVGVIAVWDLEKGPSDLKWMRAGRGMNQVDGITKLADVDWGDLY